MKATVHQQLSWEEIINQVTIASNFRNVEQAGRSWTTALGGGVALVASLEELRRKSAGWTGGGADACRRHLDDLKKAVTRNIDDHQDVGSVLLRCAEHLRTAVSSIPIPHWRYDEVMLAHQDFHDQGVFRGLTEGSIWADIRNWVADTAPRIGVADLDDWIARLRYDYSVGERRAQEVYAALCRAYDVEFDRLPAGTPVAVPAVASGGRSGGTGTADRRPATQQSSPQTAQQSQNTASTATPSPTGTSPGSSLPGSPLPGSPLPGSPLPGSPLPDPTTPDLSGLPGTGLAGVTPSDLGGGPDPRALGGGAGLKGLGGLGGLGKDAMGPAFSLPSADAMTGGRGGVGTRISGGGGGVPVGGMMGAGMGMVPGGARGSGPQASNGAHNSPLHEQDDVWGVGETGTPGVIDV